MSSKKKYSRNNVIYRTLTFRILLDSIYWTSHNNVNSDHVLSQNTWMYPNNKKNSSWLTEFKFFFFVLASVELLVCIVGICVVAGGPSCGHIGHILCIPLGRPNQGHGNSDLLYMDRGGNLKETVLRDFRPFLEDNKLYLGPICMNRQKRFRKIFHFLKEICKNVCQHSRWIR